MINTTHVWKFSPSSQIQLQRCLSVAKYDCHNKWIQKLQLKPIITDDNLDNTNKQSGDATRVTEEPMITEERTTVSENAQDIDFVCEVIDLDPLTHFNAIVDMCIKDKNTYNLLLDNLSISSVEKICNHIFITRDLSHEFVEKFYRLFLPEFFKKGYNWLSLDVLVKAKESHSEQFKILLLVLLNEKDFPSNVLQEFVSTLDTKELTGFMNNIVENDITNDMFVQNMYTIFLAYKDSKKNENIQTYVLKKLIVLSQVCSTDKNYGRFLLAFIQEQKDQTNLQVIANILEKHRSPFKRPCQNAINALKN